MQRSIYCYLFLLFSNNIFAQQAPSDTILLKNGKSVTGNILGKSPGIRYPTIEIQIADSINAYYNLKVIYNLSKAITSIPINKSIEWIRPKTSGKILVHKRYCASCDTIVLESGEKLVGQIVGKSSSIRFPAIRILDTAAQTKDINARVIHYMSRPPDQIPMYDSVQWAAVNKNQFNNQHDSIILKESGRIDAFSTRLLPIYVNDIAVYYDRGREFA